jgi:hypothetical protein
MFKGLCDRPGLTHSIKYFYGCAVCASVLLVGYMVITGAARFAESVRTERLVEKRKAESVHLSVEVTHALSAETGLAELGPTGVEALAVQLAASAKAHSVSIESFTPQGTEGTTVLDFDKTKPDQWMTNKVNIRGRGQYAQVMRVLEDMCGSARPLMLESFSLQSVDSGTSGVVEFQIDVTVYQRKSGVA